MNRQNRQGMAVEVGTHEYEASHGTTPRGRGNWAFLMGDRLNGRYLADLFWCNDLYTEARKAAKAEAKRLGCDHVSVQP